jgi:signal transduction histidine kinase
MSTPFHRLLAFAANLKAQPLPGASRLPWVLAWVLTYAALVFADQMLAAPHSPIAISPQPQLALAVLILITLGPLAMPLIFGVDVLAQLALHAAHLQGAGMAANPWLGALTLCVQALLGASLMRPLMHPPHNRLIRPELLGLLLGAFGALSSAAILAMSSGASAADLQVWLTFGLTHLLGSAVSFPALKICMIRHDLSLRVKLGVSAISLLGTCLAAMLAWQALLAEQTLIVNEFQHSAHLVGRAVQNTLGDAQMALESLRALTSSAEPPTQQGFAAVATPLLRHERALESLSWGTQRAPILDVRLAPTASDLYALPASRQAMDAAKAGGKLVLSSRISATPSTRGPWRILAVWSTPAPAQARRETMVSAVIHIDSMMKDATASVLEQAGGPWHDEPWSRGLRYRLSDLSAAPTDRILYESPASLDSNSMARGTALLDFGAPPQDRQAFVLGQRRYVLETTATSALWSKAAWMLPYWVMLGTLGFAALLLNLAIVVLARRDLLATLVEHRTMELQQSQLMLSYSLEKYHQQAEQLATLLNVTPVGYAAFDALDALIYSNRAFGELAAVRHADTEHHRLDQLLRALLHASDHSAADSSQSGHLAEHGVLHALGLNQDAATRRLAVTLAAGDTRHLELRMLRFEQGQIARVLLLFDISAEMQLERSKAQFMSNAAHEIRTPLTVIAGYAELLAQMTQDAGDIVRQCSADILQKSKQVNQLLGSLLDVVELEVRGRDSLDLQPCLLEALCAQVAEAFASSRDRAPPRLRIDNSDLYVLIDAPKMRRALGHLLSNAAQFSVPGSEISIELGLASESAEGDAAAPAWIQLTVRDHGVGMSAEEAAHAFERFYRADTSGKHPGFGLGLSFVKLLVEQHEGRVTLASQPGQGTAVTIGLPRYSA